MNGAKFVALGDVVEVVGGGTPPKNNPRFYGGPIPWATVRDMNVDRIISTEHSITHEGLRASSSRIIPAGEVVIATRVGLGKACVLGNDTAINQDLRGLIPKPSAELDRAYLLYWYRSIADQVVAAGTGATVQGVKLPFIKGLPLPLLPMDGQKRIVAVLDEAFEQLIRAQENVEENLQDLKSLALIIRNEAFSELKDGYIEKPLSDLIDIFHGYAFEGVDFTTDPDVSLPIVLTPGNYTEDGVLRFTERNTKRLTTNPQERFVFQNGDLTVVMTDLSPKMNILGKPAFIEDENILHNQRIGRIRFTSRQVVPRLLYHFLRSSVASDEIKRTATGTMVRHTAPSRVLGLRIFFPTDEAVQNDLVSKLDRVETETRRLREGYAYGRQDLTALRKSLLEKAFSGELT